MDDSGTSLPTDRSRTGWWLFVAALGAAAAYLAYSFVGLLVTGVFGYYATRPISDRVDAVVDSDAVAAGVTVLVVLVPVVALTLYAGFQLVTAVQAALGGAVDPLSVAAGYVGLGEVPAAEADALRDAVRNPEEFVRNPRQKARTVLTAGATVVGALAGTFLFVALSITLSYFLLKTDDALSDGLERLFGGRDTTAYAYATALDADLESVFFGNLLFVALMAVLASLAYAVTAAATALTVPMIVVLGFLTGVASLIPVVVGKVVYVPLVGYLAYQAAQPGGPGLVLVGVVAVCYFFLLDFLPQTFLQPYISGRELDGIVLMFAYLLGPVLFGWYGFFLLPIVFVAILECVRIVLPELLHGERLTTDATMGESVGTDPREEGVRPADDRAESETGPTADGDG